MKIVFNAIIILSFCGIAISQSPNKMSYQAVVRKSDNTLLTNSLVGAQISILQSYANGAVVYSERHTVSTNDNGLVTFEIGNGTVQSGNFASIDWSKGPYFVKSEFDPAGGTSYAISSTTQFISVPYALYAEKSSNTLTHYIGEVYEGGIVFHVYKDRNGTEHGLVVSLEDVSSGISWSNRYTDEIGVTAKSSWNGNTNTKAIIKQSGHFESAAQVCDQYTGGGKTDWYLPSLDELNLLHKARYELNKTLETDNDPNTLPILYYDYYWSSTEAKNYSAWTKHFATGADNTNGKPSQYAVRAVRSF
jgi:hypothetical protein